PVGTTQTELVPSSISDQSLNTIARSPWPDELFSGEISTFRVHDRALSAEEIAAASEQDAEINQEEIQQQVQNLLEGADSPPERIESDNIGLPTAGGVVLWSSSDSSVIAEDGRVNQPEHGPDPIEVTPTATASIRGITETSEHV